MATITNCPEPEELRQLLDGSLSGERQQDCTSHMDSCLCCQAKLEAIATDGTNLSQLVEHLDVVEPNATSAYWPAVQALDANFQETFVPRSTARRKDASLDFLQPATDPAYLGRLAQFDVMRVIGRGGMGIVLEAFDSKLQRNVAVKVLDPDLADDDISRQRFCREARAAASISHENVVAVHQVEKSGDEGLPYLVMQLITGESLEQRLARDKTLPLREIVRIGLQASLGLAAAHAQGLIHRDVKPGNILLEPPNDRVKLTDFGLARVADDVKLTRTGFVTGTPLYMAPEQTVGDDADPRSDLFSLGAILYEMCAGEPPFKGNSALVILKQISEAKHRPVRELNPAVPEWLAFTIDRLLAKKPEDRIQTAAQLAELFEFEWALIKATSEEVPQVCQIEQRREQVRNRWIAAGIGATFLTFGLLGGLFFASGKGNKTTTSDVAVSSAEPVAVLSANAGTVWSVAFDATGDTVAMAVEDGSVRLWDRATKSVKATFAAHRGVVWEARFTRTGDRLATAGDDGFIKLWKPDRTEPLQTFKHANAVRGFAFSHDDQRIFAGDREGGLKVWSLDAEQPLAEATQPGAVYAVALSPDDATLATAGNDKVVRLWNAKSLTQKLPLEGHTGPVYGLAFNHDGQRVASVGWDKTVRIWDAASGQLVKSWEAHHGDIWGVAYSPDGTKLATGGHDGAVKLWNAETGDLLATYLGHEIAIHTVAFNADGTLLASGGRDGAIRLWKIE
ncbi:MAG: serine/threonine-protein kinase [Planctomycetaceae bacterium]|nr:serine/threonine-protein kinase [Planctomycetaceae bacterium]